VLVRVQQRVPVPRPAWYCYWSKQEADTTEKLNKTQTKSLELWGYWSIKSFTEINISNKLINIVTGCCRCNRIPGTTVPLPLNGEAISVVTVSYSENKPTAMHGEYTTDVSPVTNPSQCRNELWDMVSSLPSASAHLKESRAETVS
jgi:hypothetical protein